MPVGPIISSYWLCSNLTSWSSMHRQWIEKNWLLLGGNFQQSQTQYEGLSGKISAHQPCLQCPIWLLAYRLYNDKVNKISCNHLLSTTALHLWPCYFTFTLAYSLAALHLTEKTGLRPSIITFVYIFVVLFKVWLPYLGKLNSVSS